MKLISFILLVLPLWAVADDFVVTGEYQGKNLYVQNPLSGDRLNFCTQFVYLNDELSISNPKTSAFEIDLSHLNIGDPLVIKITHRSDCLPKIINPQVIRFKSKFQFLAASANENEIAWMTRGEYKGGTFKVERYVNGEWIIDKSISGKGSFEINQYSIAPEYHAGENQLRLKYRTENGNIFYSRVFEHYSDVDPVTFYPVRVTDKIYLSRKTDYEIFDPAGKLIAEGSGEVIHLGTLKAGLYYLNIENRTEKFFKK